MPHGTNRRARVRPPRINSRARAMGAPRPGGWFPWALLWAHAGALSRAADAEQMAAQAEWMGFNQVCAEPRPDLVRAVRARGLGFYAWWINLRVADMKAFARAHPDRLQRVAPEEEALVGTPRRNPDRDNVHPGDWLCPDRGLSEEEWRGIEAALRVPGVSGLALDYVGYRNYRACYCADSEARRAAYARRHPEWTREQAASRFSEDALVDYTRQIRERVRALDPRLALAIHVYPDFDPNPDYARRLAVDYCGQTVAWFYRPNWPLKEVRARTARGAGQPGRPASQIFVPFVGAYAGAHAKTPGRLRAELRIAGTAGTGAIMVAFYETFRAQPDLASVVAEALNPRHRKECP